MLHRPKLSLLKAISTFAVMILIFNSASQASEVCVVLTEGVGQSISGVDDTLTRLVQRAMPFVDEDIQRVIRQTGAGIAIPQGSGVEMQNKYQLWLQDPSDASAHAILTSAEPIIKSAMIPFIHRLNSVEDWDEIFNQLNLELLQHLQVIQSQLAEEDNDEGFIRNPGPFGVGSPRVWFVRQIRSYLQQGEGSQGLTFEGLRNADLTGSADLSEQLLADGFTLQEVALMAEARSISFEDMLGVIAATRVVNAGLRFPEVSEAGVFENPPLEAYWKMELRSLISQKLATLTPREERVLRLRFGLVQGEEAMTIDDVAAEFRVSRERVRQIEMKGLRKLKHPSRSSILRLYELSGLSPAVAGRTNGTTATFSQEFLQLIAERAVQNPEVLKGMSEDLLQQMGFYKGVIERRQLVESEHLKAVSDLLHRIQTDSVMQNTPYLLVDLGQRQQLTARLEDGIIGIILRVALNEEVRTFKLRMDAWIRLVHRHTETGQDLTDPSILHWEHVNADFGRLWSRYGPLVEATQQAAHLQVQWMVQHQAGMASDNQRLTNNMVRVLASRLKSVFEGLEGFDAKSFNETFGTREPVTSTVRPSDLDPSLNLLRRMLGPDFTDN